MKYITPIVVALLSIALLVVGGPVFSIYTALLGGFTFWGMLKIIKRVREVPLYIEIINYILIILIVIAKHNVLNYQLLSILLLVNISPLLIYKKKYNLTDLFSIASIVLIIGSAFSILLYVREQSLYKVLYVLLIVIIGRVFYELADKLAGKNYNKLNMSFEGIICSIIMSTCLGGLFYFEVLNKFNTIIFIFGISLFISMCSVSGKMFFEYVKRELKINDPVDIKVTICSIMSFVSSIIFAFMGYVITMSIL